MMSGPRLTRRLALAIASVALPIRPGAAQETEAERPPVADAPANAAVAILEEEPARFIPREPRSAEEADRLDALRIYATARALEARRQWDKAIEQLERALELDPEAVPALRSLARLRFITGRSEEAVEAGRQVIELHPEDYETLQRLVRYYRRSNQTGEVERLLNQVLVDPDLPEFCPSRLVALHDLAMLFVESGEPAKAAVPLVRLIEALDSKAATELTTAEERAILGDEADAYRTFGVALFQAEEFDTAILALRRSLLYDPESLQTPLYLAQAQLLNGQPEEALETLEPIIAEKPPGRVAFDVLAQVLEALGRSEEVIPRLRDAAEANPKNVELQYALAERLEEEGRVAEARALYDELIANQPDPEGLGALAQSLQKQQKYRDLLLLFERARAQPRGQAAVEPIIKRVGTEPELASRLIETGLEMLRDDPPKLGQAGRALLVELATKADQIDELVELDRLILEQDPEPRTYLELVNTLRKAGRPAEAATTLEELIERYPRFAETDRMLLELARLQFEAGRHKDALRTGRTVLERNPADLVAIETVGFALNKLERYDEATQLYRTIPERFPGNPEAIRLGRIWLANALVNADRFEEGEKELEALLEENPDDPWINNDLGYMWADRGMNLQRAEAMIRKAVEADPENSAYLDSLGWVLYKQDQLEEAVPYLEQAVEIRPSATNLDHLGDVYYRLGQADKARRAWERALELIEDADPPDPLLEPIRAKLEELGDAGRDPEDTEDNP